LYPIKVLNVSIYVIGVTTHNLFISIQSLSFLKSPNLCDYVFYLLTKANIPLVYYICTHIKLTSNYAQIQDACLCIFFYFYTML